MLHYHVWFNLKPEVSEAEGLGAVSAFLAGLAATGEVHRFQLARNSGRPPRSQLPAYHVLVEFADADAMAAAMKNQVQRGIHTGGHGRVVDVVCDFHVEVFTRLSVPAPAEVLQACEI